MNLEESGPCWIVSRAYRIFLVYPFTKPLGDIDVMVYCTVARSPVLSAQVSVCVMADDGYVVAWLTTLS